MKRAHLSALTLVLALAAAIALQRPSVAADNAPAISYPTRPVRIVVPLSAGGPTDILARIVAPALSKRLGTSIIVDNKPGAGGNIGAEFVAHAEPDGYTLFLGTSGPLSINQSLYRHLSYDPEKSFVPIAKIATAPFVVVVNANARWTTLAGFIAQARHDPGRLTTGAVTGAAAHLATELFKSEAGIDLVHVAYKGAAQATNDLLAGQIDASFASTPGVLPLIKAGRLRPLAVTSQVRLNELANVPTIAESGLKGYEASVWYGLVAPAGTPAGIVDRLNREVVSLIGEPSVRQQITGADFTPDPSTSEAFSRLIASETQKWGGVVRKAGVTAE